jgi:UDP-3-O-[3-hydroxymyristoyl] N-acetylglucosamine deacetylase
MRQSTLKAPIEFSGVGLHSGEECRMTIRPAEEYAGVTFLRHDGLISANDTSEPSVIVAAPENVVRACHGTTLADVCGANSGDASVATVEHVMAALAICAVDNVAIDIYGPEIPILDGSAAPFMNKINAVGIASQSAERNEIIIEEPMTISDGDRSIHIEPSDAFCLDITIEFEDCVIGCQSQSVTLDNPSLLARMARSRTFCRLHEVEALRAMDLIRGGSLDNSIVVDGDKVLNGGELRDPYEFVLHKALDLVGDLYLLGAPIRGSITAHKPGHSINTRAALAISQVQQAQNTVTSRIAATA